MNGGLLMDHEEMKAAYLRALDLPKNDFSYQCNNCKVGYLPNHGEIMYLRTNLKDNSQNTSYKLWHCDRCPQKEIINE